MNAELKQKWIAALRSGEWKQGMCHLRLPNSEAYCCLGVLCKVSGEGLTWSETRKDWVAANPLHQAGDSLAWGSFGLSIANIDNLTDLNDSGSDFPTIADWIAENIEEEG